MGAGSDLPQNGEGKVFLSIRDDDKTPDLLAAAQTLSALGHALIATSGTAKWLSDQGLEVETVKKVYEGKPNVVDQLKDGKISHVMNTTEGAMAIAASRDIRAVALMDFIKVIEAATGRQALLEPKPMQPGDVHETLADVSALKSAVCSCVFD